MARQFLTMQSVKVADDTTERALRDIRAAVMELQDVTRTLEEQNAHLGIGHYSMSANQTSVATGNTVSFDTEDKSTAPSSALSFSSSRNSWRLYPGYKYRLLASALIYTASDQLELEWRDSTNGATLSKRAAVNSGSGNASQASVASWLIEPTETIEVIVYVSYAAGSPSIGLGYSWASVEVMR